jgi:hypothetical protein
MTFCSILIDFETENELISFVKFKGNYYLLGCDSISIYGKVSNEISISFASFFGYISHYIV